MKGIRVWSFGHRDTVVDASSSRLVQQPRGEVCVPLRNGDAGAIEHLATFRGIRSGRAHEPFQVKLVEHVALVEHDLKVPVSTEVCMQLNTLSHTFSRRTPQGSLQMPSTGGGHTTTHQKRITDSQIANTVTRSLARTRAPKHTRALTHTIA